MDKDQTTKPRPLAVVTGASSGIGYELAVQFAKHGFDLLIVAEDEAIAQAANDLQAHGTDVQSIQQDLASHEGVEAFHRAIVATGRPVEAIAINAGVGVNGKFFETDLEKEMNLIDLNVMSTVHLAKRVVQDMVERGQSGKILFTSSVAAIAPGPYMAVYYASNAFVQSFALALNYELKEKGITVTALMPGATETNFFERADMEDTKVGAGEKDDPAQVAKQGFEALMEGKDRVIAGSLKHRLVNAAYDLLPESVKMKKTAEGSKPGSAAEVSNDECPMEQRKEKGNSRDTVVPFKYDKQDATVGFSSQAANRAKGAPSNTSRVDGKGPPDYTHPGYPSSPETAPALGLDEKERQAVTSAAGRGQKNNKPT